MFTVAFEFTVQAWHLIVAGVILWVMLMIITTPGIFGEQSKLNKILYFPFVALLWVPRWIYSFFAVMIKKQHELAEVKRTAEKHNDILVHVVSNVYLYISKKRFYIPRNMFLVRTKA